MKYRPEIDGLRALAVIPVVLFHAGFQLFGGGFVGVDIFFVISGYLITTILIEDIEAKQFSIIDFYERRARRILPALFFIMLVCIPFGYLYLLPDELENFGQSLFATTLFSNNILLATTTGYWQLEGEFKPLIHTWSLGVEEQYYFLFPLFLIFAWRFGKRKVFLMIIFMAVISLLISEWGWRNQPTANFYLLPTRAWELFAGSIAAFIIQHKGLQNNNGLASLGLAAIVFSIFSYSENTPFPSAYALAPVLGVVLLVLYAGKETWVAKLLSTKLFVGMGLISYSAYLWHQPLLAFSKDLSAEPISNLEKYLLVILTFILAFFTYTIIEKNFRKPGLIRTKSFLVVVSIAAFVLIVSGFWFHAMEGFARNFYGETMYGSSKVWEQYNENFHKKFIDKNFTEKNHEIQRKKLLIIGNSFGRDFSNALGEVGLLRNVSFLFKHVNNIGFDTCSLVNNPLPIEVSVSDVIIFGFDGNTKCSVELIDRLSSLGKVSYFAGYKNFGYNFGWLKRKANHTQLTLECSSRLDKESKTNLYIKSLINNKNLLDIQGFFNCNNDNGVIVTDDAGRLLSVDRTHLTSFGALYLGQAIVKKNHKLINDLKYQF